VIEMAKINFLNREPNRYQHDKARAIVNMLLAQHTTLSRHQICQAVAMMNSDQWRTICFAAGQPVADIECKALVLMKLRQKAPRLVTR
jgi:hypothetical protein